MRTKYIYVTSHVRASTRHWDHWHKNARSGEGTRGCHKAEDKGRLGIYFVEDKLKREVDWLIFLDSDDYYWQDRVWREATARAIARAEEGGPRRDLHEPPYFRKRRFSQP